MKERGRMEERRSDRKGERIEKEERKGEGERERERERERGRRKEATKGGNKEGTKKRNPQLTFTDDINCVDPCNLCFTAYIKLGKEIHDIVYEIHRHTYYINLYTKKYKIYCLYVYSVHSSIY